MGGIKCLGMFFVTIVFFAVGMVYNCSFFSERVLAAGSTLNKKTLLVDGDSIAYGKTGETKGGKKVVYSFANYLHEKYQMKVKNVAVSGSRYYRSTNDKKRIANHLTSGVKNTSYDYIILEGGTNDVHAYKNKTEKSFTNLRAYLSMVTSNKKWETAKIGFVIVPHPNYEKKGYDSSMPGYEKKFWNKVKTICGEYSIPVINLYGKNWLDEKGGTVDGLHPSVSVQKKMGKEIASWMESLPNYKYEVKFDLNGLTISNSIGSQMVLHGKKATAPDVKVKDSKYKFKYWSATKGGKAYDFSSAVNSNLILYAVYDVAKTENNNNSNGGKGEGGNTSVDQDGDEASQRSDDITSSPSSSNSSSSETSQSGNATDDVCDNSGVSQIVKDAAGCDKKKSAKLESTTTVIINSIISVLGIVAVIMIVIGGIQFMTSTGDGTKVAKAKKTIIYAAVGLAICALSFVIVNWVIGVIN